MRRSMFTSYVVLLGFFGALLVPVSNAPAAEVIVKNDSLVDALDGTPLAAFIAGESAAAWLTSPCDGEIVSVYVFWRSIFGGSPQTLEDSITVFDAGVFPTPGAQSAQILGPMLTDGSENEFSLIGQEVSVSQDQVFVVSIKFFNTQTAFSPSVVKDNDGCQMGKNAVFVIPGGWLNVCLLGVTGDFAIRAKIQCGSQECASDEDCDDGDYCFDYCDPDSPNADAGGCVMDNGVYGDVNRDGFADIDDTLETLACFGGDCSACVGGTVYGCDIIPCGGDAFSDIDDTLATLAAFGGDLACTCD